MSSLAERLLRAVLAVAFSLVGLLVHARGAERQSYAIPAGEATVTLQQYVDQSREEIVYLLPNVRGILTNPVAGKFTAIEAIGKLLANTGLLFVQDRETGAIMITRAVIEKPAAPPPVSAQAKEPPSDPTMKSKNLLAVLATWIGLLAPAHDARPADANASTSSAASADRGMIRGRVFNPATGEYIRNVEIRVDGSSLAAISEDGGFFRLTNVPAGTVGLTATYTGHKTLRATVMVAARAVAVQDFEMTQLGVSALDATVKLDAFIVATERAGQAKAVAEQKNAMNVKTVMASDNFGDIFEGNVGEFLKFMPGITLDYVETDTRSARIGGLEAQYGYVTVDGATMANTNSLAGNFRDNARSFEFEAVSINNIESIEVNKTLSADMPGDAPAGTINLRTKSALDRKGQRFSFAVAMVGNEYEYTLHRTARPDDARHAKVRPTGSFDYSTALFDNKLGIAINGSFTNVFKEQFRITNAYDYTSAQALAYNQPLVNVITYKDGPKLTEKSSGGLKLDYQPFPALRLSLTSSFTLFADEMSNRTVQLRAIGWLGPGSSMTRLVGMPSNNIDTRLMSGGSYSRKTSDTTNLSLGFTYKNGRLTADGLASYSRARWRNGAEQHQTVDFANLQLTRISFIAERPSPDSTAWSFTQTSGRDWNDLANWGRDDPQANNVSSQHSVAKSEEYVGQINVKYEMKWAYPTFFKTGLHKQVSTRSRNYNQFFYTKTYVGPTNNQLNAVIPASSADLRISPAWGGNLYSLPVTDRKAVWDLHQAHPEYFTTTPARLAADLEETLGNPQSNQEQINAAYIMQNTRVGKWQFQGGVRAEATRTKIAVKAAVPVSENPFAIVTTNATTGRRTYTAANTPDYVTYKWSRPPAKDWGAYDHFLPSFSAKYSIMPDLIMKLGYNKGTKRPRLDYMAGRWTINAADTIITIPNSELSPERSDKVSAMFEYYVAPSGTIGVHLFRTTLKGASDRIGPVPASEVGLANDPVYGDYEFITYVNVPGTRVIKGIELNYSQQFPFLPYELLRGTSIFATYSRYNSHDRPANFIPQNATAGLNWRYRRFSAGISGTWNDEFRTGANSVPANSRFFPNEPEYVSERFLFDVNAAFQLNRNISLFVTGRDAFNSGRKWYYKGENRLRQMELFGAQWSIGVKGTY